MTVNALTSTEIVNLLVGAGIDVEVATALATILADDTPSSNDSGGSGSDTCYNFTRDLTLGSSGSDVVALQDFLEDKGHLIMPAGVSKGYFGYLTQSSLASWQRAHNIYPPSGYFGVLTRTAYKNYCSSNDVPTIPGVDEDDESEDDEALLNIYGRSTDVEKSYNGDDEMGVFKIKFEVDARNGDIYIPATHKWIAPQGSYGFDLDLVQGGRSVNDKVDFAAIGINSASDNVKKSNGRYIIEEGETVAFDVYASFVPMFSDTYSLGLKGINYSDSLYGSVNEFSPGGKDSLYTDKIYLETKKITSESKNIIDYAQTSIGDKNVLYPGFGVYLYGSFISDSSYNYPTIYITGKGYSKSLKPEFGSRSTYFEVPNLITEGTYDIYMIDSSGLKSNSISVKVPSKYNSPTFDVSRSSNDSINYEWSVMEKGNYTVYLYCENDITFYSKESGQYVDCDSSGSNWGQVLLADYTNQDHNSWTLTPSSKYEAGTRVVLMFGIGGGKELASREISLLGNYSTVEKPLSATINASSTSIMAGESTYIWWTSTGATDCYSREELWMNDETSGSVKVSPKVTTTYEIQCREGYSSVKDYVTVSVKQSNTTIDQTPVSISNFFPSKNIINSGESINIYWTAKNAKSCYPSQNSAYFDTEGITDHYDAVTPLYSSIYEIVCYDKDTNSSIKSSFNVTVSSSTNTEQSSNGVNNSNIANVLDIILMILR